jgi:LEA14-like dessication related protein
MIREKIFCGFLLPIILLSLWGCAGLGKKLESPGVHLAHIEVKEVKPLETHFLVQLRVFNKNDVSLEIKGIDCEIELNNRRFATGVSNEKISIPPLGTEVISLDVYSSVLDVIKGVLGLKDQDKLIYSITGRVHLGEGTLYPSVIPFKSKGELSTTDIIT